MADVAADTEILTEHFGYPPVSLLDDIINAINILAESALMSIEQGLLRSPPAALGFRPPRKSKKSKSSSSSSALAAEAAAAAASVEEAAKFEIDNGTHQLETLLCSSIDRNFDIFELYVMRNILCLRSDDRAWMRLRHYDGLDFSRSAADPAADPAAADAAAPSPARVSLLRRKLAASQRLTATLTAEKAQNAALLDTLRALVARTSSSSSGSGNGGGSAPRAAPAAAAAAQGPLAFLHDTAVLGTADAQAPLQTTTAFALSQLPALRTLSSSLRALAGDLQQAAAGAGDGETADGGPRTPGRRTWRKGRVEYIEAATRKHLETVRGLELGAHGEVRDGEWQKPGRKIGMAEVQGLEDVLALVGGSVDEKQQGGKEMEPSQVEDGDVMDQS